MLLKTAVQRAKLYRACFGVSAIVLILGLLAACGGGGSSDADITTSDPSATSAISDQTTTTADRSNTTTSSQAERTLSTVPDSELTLPPETTLPIPPTEDEGMGGFGNLGESLNNVLEAVLEENGTDAPAPADIRVKVEDGEIVEGETRYEVPLGDDIIIDVFSSQFNHEVHVHGYDLTDFAGPISPARFEFVADLAGTWEVEFEATSELIFELVVR